MIVATYLDPLPHLLACLEIWDASFGRWVEDRRVCTTASHVETVCEYVREKGLGCSVYAVPRFEPWEYVGGHCTALYHVKCEDEDTLLLTDPDVLAIGFPWTHVLEAEKNPWYFSALVYSEDQLELEVPFHGKYSKERYERLWGNVSELLVGQRMEPRYFNTGVIITKGLLVRLMRKDYPLFTRYLYETAEEHEIRHWIQEQVAHALALQKHDRVEIDPLPQNFNMMNHPKFETGEEPGFLHYGWKNRGFRKSEDLTSIEKFLGSKGGGPVVDRVRQEVEELFHGIESSR